MEFVAIRMDVVLEVDFDLWSHLWFAKEGANVSQCIECKSELGSKFEYVHLHAANAS
jgi:hypothetical protein